MTLEEGQIYEGEVASFGGDGPNGKWIVVAPFGKTHTHSLDDPKDLHCMPVAIAEHAIRTGRLRLVGCDREHPVVQLQRAKEQLGIRDSHMGLHGSSLNQMIGLLEQAVERREAYAPFAAGEIFAHIAKPRYREEDLDAIRTRVNDVLRGWQLTHND